MTARATIGRGIFYTRDSQGDSDLAPQQFVAWAKQEADKLGADRVWVCRGLACMLRGAYDLIEHCEDKLGVTCVHRTADGRVTLEFAECIGACDGAPAVLLNDKHVMDVTPEKADQLFASLGKAGA